MPRKRDFRCRFDLDPRDGQAVHHLSVLLALDPEDVLHEAVTVLSGLALRRGGPARLAVMRSGLTQRELAARAGVSESYLSELLSGVERPSTELLGRLAEALAMPEQQLQYVLNPEGESK